MKEGYQIPRHVAIILDGNGRWAKKKKMPRNYGHTKGSETVERICEDAYRMGISYLTVYAFSTENWNRPKEEVDALMKLLYRYLKKSQKISEKNNMRVRILGDISKLSEPIQQQIIALEESSKSCTGLQFQIAINYGGRDEIVRAIKRLLVEYDQQLFQKEQLTPDFFAHYLDTKGIPDPDLLIRTSGEQRLSNYLLWQMAYTEFYFTDVLWPDFTKADLEKAIDFFNSRERKFGLLSKES